MLLLLTLHVVSEREAEILKSLSSVEVVEKEEANFDTEISEDDIAGEWKLRGQVLMRSPVRPNPTHNETARVKGTVMHIKENSVCLIERWKLFEENVTVLGKDKMKP